MAHYFTRNDSNAAATTVYTPIEVDPVGSSLATIKIPKGVTRISSLNVTVGLNAQPVVTGAIYVVKIHGKAVTNEQEIIVYQSQYEEGGGTVTDTQIAFTPPHKIPISLPVIAGNDLQLSWAYVGTDPGTPFINITVEFK